MSAGSRTLKLAQSLGHGLDSGDWVVARIAMMGFFWPKIAIGARGMIVAVRGQEVQVHFIEANRRVWIPVDHVAAAPYLQ